MNGAERAFAEHGFAVVRNVVYVLHRVRAEECEDEGGLHRRRRRLGNPLPRSRRRTRRNVCVVARGGARFRA